MINEDGFNLTTVFQKQNQCERRVRTISVFTREHKNPIFSYKKLIRVRN